MNRIQILASHRTLAAAVVCLAVVLAQQAAAVPVIAPDNGFGTATIPPTGETYYGAQMQIINGMPPGSTIDIDNPLYHSFSSVSDFENPAGPLNYGDGNFSDFVAQLTLPMQGTGAFSTYTRTVVIPLAISGQLMHFDARATNAPMQVFTADLRRLQGQLPPGDPDFDLLRVTAGGDFGLPIPGATMLQDLGATYNVYSFFDVTYRIDFIGHFPGPFGGMSGSTTGVARFTLGDPIVPEPAAAILLGTVIFAFATQLRRR
jgi:hypothetical protein